MLEALGVKKTRVTLNFWRPLNLHTSSIFEHLTAHLGHSLSAVVLQLDKGSDDVVLKLTDELLSGVAHRENVSHLSQQFHLNIFVCRGCYLDFFTLTR